MIRSTRPFRWSLAIACLCLAAPALAEDGAVARAKPAPPAAKPAAGANAAPAKPPEAKAPAGKRTLRDVHIEGEVPVPQVLFVTARDQRRVLDFGHARYLRTSRELAASTARPARLVVPPPAAPAAPPATPPAPAPPPPSPEKP